MQMNNKERLLELFQQLTGVEQDSALDYIEYLVAREQREEKEDLLKLEKNYASSTTTENVDNDPEEEDLADGELADWKRMQL